PLWSTCVGSERSVRRAQPDGVAVPAVAKTTREAQADSRPTADMTMVQAINQALDLALSRDPTTLLFGQDVGKMGGVFRASDGLQRAHGEERVFDTPLAESGIVGFAVG